MTLLSRFTTSAGVFCFVPLSQRLVGIILARSPGLPSSAQYEEDDTLPVDQCLSPCHALFPSSSTMNFSGQDSTLCDSCDSLLRREIPPDHIPSVVRALALFEARERFSDACDVVALADAFSMLRL